MNEPLKLGDTAVEALMGAIVDEFLERLDRGERPEADEYARRYPQLATVLGQMLPALGLLRGSAPDRSVSAAASSEAIRPEGPLGDYRLVREVGRGGMGVVYEAVQISLGRRVAVKVLPFASALDARQLQRFKNEAQAAAHLHHASIVPVHGVGCDRGVHYYAMQFIEGQTLAALIWNLRRLAGLEKTDEAGSGGATGSLAGELASGRWAPGKRRSADPQPTGPYIPPGIGPQAASADTAILAVAAVSTEHSTRNPAFFRTAANLGVAAAQALEHAHGEGVVHRDIKPANLMVDGKGNLWVTDFGLAHCQSQAGLTMTGDLVGTLRYMSPEQALAQRVTIDHRTDIYSLGATLYELLTLEPVFNGRDRQELLRQIAFEEPKAPRRVNKAIPPELETIVLKAMEKNPADRYATAQELADDLERFLKDEPIRAKRPSRLQRARKWGRRHQPVVWSATVSAAVLLVLVAVIMVVSNVRITREAGEKANALAAAKASEQDAKTKEGLAKEAQQAAVENLKDALAAVDQMLTRVAEERLVYAPQMEPIRRELLQDALKFYNKFLLKNGDNPAIRRETALAYRRMGSLHYQLGDYRRAEDAYRYAFAMIDELNAESPLEPSIRSELIFYHIGFSWVLNNQGKKEEQEKALRRAVAVAEDLVKKLPEVPTYRDYLADARNQLAGAIAGTKPEEAAKILRQNLALLEDGNSVWHRAQTYQNLGALLAKQRRFSEAEDAYRQGVRFFEKAVAKSPSLRWMPIDLSGTLQQLAKIVEANGRPAEAEEICRRAVPILDQLAADFPAGPHYRWCQADVHFQHALLLKKLKRSTAAEQAYRRTVELFDKLVNDFPTLPGYRQTAVHRRHHLAQFLAEAGRVQEAQQVYDDAAAILEKLAGAERSQALKMRGNFYATLSEWDKAAADFAKAIELGSGDVLGVWYPLAVLHLRAHRPNEYRSLCEKLLERFGQTKNHWVVITCKLAPNAVADLSRPVQIAEKLVAGKPKNAEYIGILGAALYRKGDLEAAVQKLAASVRSGSGQLGVHWRRLVLAMAYHRLGRGAEAQQLFQEVTRWVEKNAQEKLKEGASLTEPLTWAHRLDLQFLHHEAEELLTQDLGLKSQKSEKKQ